ncbi:MAG TPA: S-layer homology domain-containing protein [Bacillus sp. (in: firmicutes)]|nr:S-layer homology domain-containing protein [Bacillus sp. (in: firmicutes)]
MRFSKVISPILATGLLLSAAPAYATENIAVNIEDISSAKLIEWQQKGNSSNALAQGNLSGDDSEVLYKIDLSKNGLLNIKFDSYDALGELELLDEDRNVIAHLSEGVGQSYKDQKTIGLAKGEYFLHVKEWYTSNDIFNYKLELNYQTTNYSEMETNDTVDAANNILLNTRYYASATTVNDEDLFHFQIARSGKYGIKIIKQNDSGLGGDIEIKDQDGGNVEYFSSYDTVDTHVVDLLEGDYYLGIELNSDYQEYEFEIVPLKFKDVGVDFWANKEISFLSELGVIKGYPTGEFRPNNQVTRAQAALMITRALGLNTANNPAPAFKDVPKNHQAYEAISALVAEGIYPNGQQFNPNAPLKRDDMARMLVNAYELKGATGKAFSDVPSKHWAYNYISALAANKITTGYNDNTFKPNNPITRAQFSSFMARAMDERYLPVE